MNRTNLTLKNKVFRVAWHFVWLVLFRPSPVQMFRWRSQLLRLFGAKIEASCKIYPSCRVWAPWNLVMDAGSCLASHVNVYNVAKVHLGSNALVSQGSHICSASHDYESNQFDLIASPIVLGSNSWVCADCFICPGVKIADGAVCMARSVVVKNVQENSVVAGNPAIHRKIRKVEK